MSKTRTWKRIVSIVMAVLLFLSITPVNTYLDIRSNAAEDNTKTIYLYANSSYWNQAGAWFAAWAWQGSGSGSWYIGRDDNNDGIYAFTVPSGVDKIIFMRMASGATSPNWNQGNSGYWNKTGDLTIGGNYYSISNWSGGSWSNKTVTYIVAGAQSLTGSDWVATDSNNTMTANGDGTYSITFNGVPAGNFEYKIVGYGEWMWSGANATVSPTATSNVTITYNPSTNIVTSSIELVITGPEQYDRMDEISLDSASVFYVDTDLVDYLNDERVAYKHTSGYYLDNQGIWNNAGDSQFSYFNDLLSMEVGNGNYTYPLYFGPLNFISSRYTRVVGNETRHGMSNWNSAAGTALTNGENINTDAVVQGLVGSTLLNGNLTDPVTGSELLYFSKTAAETWYNRGGEYNVMSYYADLKFPFKQVYDPATRVTTYSYDSANDYAVFYDYSSNILYASNTHVADTVLDSNSDASDYGFYPLNEPDDTGNELNHGFGAKFSIDFTVGEDGLLSNGQPVTFDFTGDDDLWVFIDGVLILDMGGAHAKASGNIDFSTLTATVSDAYTVSQNGILKNADSQLSSSYVGLDNSWLFYTNNVPTEERANVTAAQSVKTFAELGLENFDYSAIHTMTVFYMERGGIESNFSMEFTMVPVPSGMTLSKELNEKDINAGLMEAIGSVSDYTFSLSATSPSSTTSVAFPSYGLTNKHTGEVTVVSVSGTTSGRKYTATINGITDYTYAHSFLAANGDPAFIPGTSFSIVESTKGIFSYSGTSWQVYDAKNSYTPLFNRPVSGSTVTFTMGQANDNIAYSYAVTCINTMNVGNLQISKIFDDALLKDTVFSFQVYLDLDGSGSTFDEALYQNLVYNISGSEYTSDDGSISLKGGETALISGIPAGATYRLVEVISADAPWSQTASSNTTGTITANATKSSTFTNAVKTSTEDKVIFVEAGTATTYSPKYNGNAITITAVSNATSGLTATVNNGSITVTGSKAGMVYTVDYTGRLANNEIVTGTIRVYSYAATHNPYVFDFGLSSNLADTTYGDGVFQGGAFYNSGISGTSATLLELVAANGNTQTTITYSKNGTIGTTGSYSAINFTPVAFMSQVETYTYTVRISVNGKTFVEGDPETGTILTGTITIMPANAVYYEDNFNATGTKNPINKIVYSNSAPTKAPTLTQSNDSNSNYGYDAAYLGGYAQSAGSATTLSNGQYAYFTFTGTGFDLISRTNGSTAGFAIYVFAGGHKQAYITYMTSFSGATPTAMKFVDTYYNNGDLQQVPVASVRLDSYGQYTVYIQALTTRPGLSSVSVDGIRIYNPLGTNTGLYPLKAEQNTTIDELRVLYGVKDIVSLAGKGSKNNIFVGTGKGEVVQDALKNASIVENMEGNAIQSAADLESIYTHGPNNEMYLPKNFGIGFSYTVNSTDWTLQLGAKAVTASSTIKSISIYAKSNRSSTYTLVGTITLSSATDMYYDLTALLADYSANGSTYDIVIVSNSDFASNEFVSLTTVKHAGITLS